MSLENIGIRHSPLSERILIARFGKDPQTALETRDGTNEFLHALVQFVGAGNEVSFGGGDEQFVVRLLTKQASIEKGWQPISTAPDDLIVLLTDINWPASRMRGGKPPVKCGYRDKTSQVWTIWGASWSPTHWMPTPTPPES